MPWCYLIWKSLIAAAEKLLVTLYTSMERIEKAHIFSFSEVKMYFLLLL